MKLIYKRIPTLQNYDFVNTCTHTHVQKKSPTQILKPFDKNLHTTNRPIVKCFETPTHKTPQFLSYLTGSANFLSTPFQNTLFELQYSIIIATTATAADQMQWECRSSDGAGVTWVEDEGVRSD